MDLRTKWEGRSVLVTGAGGFIGGALAMALVDLGASVVAITKNVEEIDGCTTVVADTADYRKMCDVISSNEIDTIFHLAGSAIVRISSKDPMSTYHSNVMGTVGLLEAARTVGRVKSIICASSDKAYGDHEILPYVETFPLQPKNTYDASKACMDMIGRSYAWNYGMPIVVTRCSNVYGPGDKNFSRLVPNSTRMLLKGARPIIYSDVENMEREFIYIDDVVEAYLLLADTAVNGEAYNIGGTGPVKIRDLIKKLAMAVGCPEVEPNVIQRDPLFKEIQKQYIDASKIEAVCGWKPTTSLETGLRKTVEYYQNVAIEKFLCQAGTKYGIVR